MPNEFDAIARVTDAKYEFELAKMQRIAAQEAQLREAIQTLEAQAKDAVVLSAQVAGMPALGADQVWRTWLLERRKTCQMELALILAEKSEAKNRLATAFGRANVAEALRSDAETQAKLARSDKAMTSLNDHVAWRR